MTDKTERKGKVWVSSKSAVYLAMYPTLQEVARKCGYALAVHGSLNRDMDLIAMPWVEGAIPPKELISALKRATGFVTHTEEHDHLIENHNPSVRPFGRLSYSLHATNLGMEGPYLDISVMYPTPQSVEEVASLEIPRKTCQICNEPIEPEDLISYNASTYGNPLESQPTHRQCAGQE